MKISESQLEAKLLKDKPNVFIILGEEPLRIQELANKIYHSLAERDFITKDSYLVTQKMDWAFLSKSEENMDLFSNKKIINPRKHILYEYHWEWNFPATPTCLAIRTNKYKYIYYHGIWDRNGLYDLEHDPNERHNLIQLPQYKEITTQLRNQLFSELESSGGLNMPIRPPKGEQFYDRKLR